MSTVARFVRTASSFVQFFPLSVFATYAFPYGVPANERWVAAFKLAAVAAVIQLVIVHRGPPSRPTLGAPRETRGAPRNTRATFTVLPDVSHLGLVVHRRTAEEITAWLGRLP